MHWATTEINDFSDEVDNSKKIVFVINLILTVIVGLLAALSIIGAIACVIFLAYLEVITFRTNSDIDDGKDFLDSMTTEKGDGWSVFKPTTDDKVYMTTPTEYWIDRYDDDIWIKVGEVGEEPV